MAAVVVGWVEAESGNPKRTCRFAVEEGERVQVVLALEVEPEP